MASAHELLTELKSIASATMRQATIAAKHDGLALVNEMRLQKLEQLVVALKESSKSALMTREYSDILKAHQNERYNGKRFLLRRQEFAAVLQLLNELEGPGIGPSGWAVNED